MWRQDRHDAMRRLDMHDTNYAALNDRIEGCLEIDIFASVGFLTTLELRYRIPSQT